jgi:xanthine dehydrogenase accessory factor
MMSARLAQRAEKLAAGRVPFAMATVVRAQRPTSVRAGASALVLGDGTIEGFVGGVCAEESVRLHALRALETGEPLLLRIVPGGAEAAASSEGAVTVENPCLSGGALEIFIEPRLPAPRLTVVGDSPVALALAELGPHVGFDVVLEAGAEFDCEPGDAGVVVASHGRAEEPALARALDAGAAYVALVASEKRGTAVLGFLRDQGLAEDELGRVRTPAGLDIGAETPSEIALAILAEIVKLRREAGPLRVPAAELGAAPSESIDPVCGMTVSTAGRLWVEHEGQRVHFCSEHCMHAFEAEPERYAAAL